MKNIIKHILKTPIQAIFEIASRRALSEIKQQVKKNREQSSEHLVYSILQPYLPKRYYPITNYIASPSIILSIMNDIVMNDHRHIVELGSGFSTLCLARFIQAHNYDIKFYSIDHDKRWYKILQKMLKLEGLENSVEHIYTPLVPYKHAYEKNLLWYDTNILDNYDFQSIDLLVIDGPPMSYDPFIRYSAFPYFRNRLSQNVTIIIDDAKRDGERKLLEAWKQNSDFVFTHYHSFATTDASTIAIG